jgi:thiol peroxidase
MFEKKSGTKMLNKTTHLIITGAIVLLLAALMGGVIGAGVDSKEMSMKERTGITSTRGKPLTLLGNEVKIGDKAPNVEVIANDMSPVKLSSYRGKVCVIASVPSLDTKVCDIETRRFNEEAGKLGPDVVILTISRDLPFAQKRWCGAAGIDKVQTLSDYREANFGLAYGVLVKETRLLARAVFVVDKEGVIRYIQIVDDTSKEPNYQAVLDAIKSLK